MSWLSRFSKFFRKEEKGNVLIIVALGMIVLLGMAALVVDVGALYGTRRQAVNAADAAALSGALEGNEQHAENRARQYALENNEANLVGVEFTYPGQGQGDSDFRTITVLVSREVSFSFARVLGFENSTVHAMASAQQGPGNGIVPVGLIGNPCDCGTGENIHDCGCSPADHVYGGECGCKEGYEKTIWKIIKEDNDGNIVCAKPGDRLILKEDHPFDGALQSPGNFNFLQLPGSGPGANVLRKDFAGGYDGPLSSVEPGEPVDTKTGSVVSIKGAIEDRMAVSNNQLCYTLEDLPDDIYSCDMVVVIPLVRITKYGGGATIELEIVAYASFLLDVSEGVSGHQIPAYLIEYLTYDELIGIYGPHLTGFVIRLVDDPTIAKNNLLALIE